MYNYLLLSFLCFLMNSGQILKSQKIYQQLHLKTNSDSEGLIYLSNLIHVALNILFFLPEGDLNQEKVLSLIQMRSRTSPLRPDAVTKWGYQGRPDTCECGVKQSDEHLIR